MSHLVVAGRTSEAYSLESFRAALAAYDDVTEEQVQVIKKIN